MRQLVGHWYFAQRPLDRRILNYTPDRLSRKAFETSFSWAFLWRPHAFARAWRGPVFTAVGVVRRGEWHVGRFGPFRTSIGGTSWPIWPPTAIYDLKFLRNLAGPAPLSLRRTRSLLTDPHSPLATLATSFFEGTCAMPAFFWQSYQSIMRWVLSLNKQEWLALLVVVTVVGFLCMRGYGSRNNY
jgi:hypothetical protein